MVEHCLSAHESVLETAEGQSKLKALNVKIENLSKRGVLTLDRTLYGKHLKSLRRKVSPEIFEEIDIVCKNLLLECMVLIGDAEKYDQNNYLQLRQSYETLLW